MNLYFTGHQEKYAVEQTMLTLFPQERPVYPCLLYTSQSPRDRG